MKRYAISWYDDSTITIKMEIVDAENDVEALKMAFRKLTRITTKGYFTEPSEVKALARSYEGAIEAIEIYEPEYLPAADILRRFINGMSNAIPSKVPQYAH